MVFKIFIPFVSGNKKLNPDYELKSKTVFLVAYHTTPARIDITVTISPGAHTNPASARRSICGAKIAQPHISRSAGKNGTSTRDCLGVYLCVYHD